MFNGNNTDLKGKPVVNKTPSKGVTYRVLSPFTNWVTSTKYVKGDKVTITEEDMKGFETAMNQGRLRKV